MTTKLMAVIMGVAAAWSAGWKAAAEAADGAGLYCVLDLSAGAEASSYPVAYLDAVPSGGWTDEYKTSKIVLRRIDGPIGAYYAGVFEITEPRRSGTG